jgi:outer membrane protein assembly factor BamA
MPSLLRFFLLCSIVSGLFSFTPAAASRTPAHVSKAEVKIGSLHFTGQKQVTEEQAIAASGLKVGQFFDPKKLDAASEKLGKSGVFQDVSYRYHPEAGQMAVEFNVKEAARFHRCVFDNFVWIADDELQQRLKKDIPLYTGVVPESGDILDDIAHALESFLHEKGITAQVVHIQEGRLGDQNWVHLYTANGPAVKIQSVSFTGVLIENLTQLKRQAAPLVGRDYSQLQCGLYGANTFLPFYRERGYLRADVGPSAAHVLNHVDGANDFFVEVTYPVTEGAPYKWTPVDWSGSQLLAPPELESLMGLKPHDLANGIKIDDGWDAIRKAYSKKGYLEVRLKQESSFDEQSLHVRYRVSVSDGPQYHMGNFLVSGVSQDAAERLKRIWRLKPGEVFDATYIGDFSKRDLPSALQGVVNRGAKVNLSPSRDREHHLGDVTLRVE